MDTPSPTLTLNAAAGGSISPDMVRDLAKLRDLPPDAIASIWQVLRPVLVPSRADETGRAVEAHCARYGLSAEDLAVVLRALGSLIDAAVRLDLPSEKLAADIEKLFPDAPEIKMVLLAGYDSAKEQLRRTMVAGALADHGNMLVGAQWRVDIVDSADRGTRLKTPVAMLTLHYQEGKETRRITLQALPDMVAELRAICDKILK